MAWTFSSHDEVIYEVEMDLARALLFTKKDPTIENQIDELSILIAREEEIVSAHVPKQSMGTQLVQERAMLKAIYMRRLLSRMARLGH